MKPQRIGAIAAALIGAAAVTASLAAAQTSFPEQRNITVVVPAAAGGTTDIIARVIAKVLGQSLDRSVIVENRAGANGNVGSAYVARAAPDGHTLLVAPSNNVVINQFVMAHLGYDPIADLAPVALVADTPLLIIAPAAFPAATLQEFVQAVRAKPDAYSYGSPGAGTPPYLASERLLKLTGLTMPHVPYRGAAPALADVASGNIQLSMAALGSAEPFRQAGTIRILAVAAPQRMKAIPDVPTTAQAGFKDFEFSTWWAVLAPKQTPAAIVNTLNARLQEAFTDPETVRLLGNLGIVAKAQSVDSFETYIQSELKKWKGIVDDIGLKPQ